MRGIRPALATGLRHNVDVGAGAAPISRIVQRRLHVELLDCIRVGDWNAGIPQPITASPCAEVVDLNAVHLEVVVDAARTIYEHVLRVASKVAGVIYIGLHPGGKIEDLGVIPRREWERFDRLTSHQSTECRALGLYQLGVSMYADFFFVSFSIATTSRAL